MGIRTRCTNCGHVSEGPTWILGRTGLCEFCHHYYVAKALKPRPGSHREAPPDPPRKKIEDDPPETADPAATTDHPSAQDGERAPGDSQPAPLPAPDAAPPADSASHDQPAPLGQIGRFVLRAYLGHGSFGSVYRAYDPVLDREVALKVPKFSVNHPQKIRRFLAEAKAAARLRHPNLVAVYESGQAGDDLYIAAEFVAGVPLSVRLAEQPPSPRQAAQWVRDLALALAYAHGKGIIHRDIKPANIMIDQEQRPQLMDFGLAKRLAEGAEGAMATGASGSDDPCQTVQGTVLGTPAYMAPEQARGDLKAVGPHSDQYSLGVVFYELLTQQLPFQGTPREVITQVLTEEPPRPRRLNRRIPRALEAICLRAMAKAPAERYATAADLAVDLQRWLTDESIQARPFSPPERLWHWCRHNPRWAVLAAVAAALVLTALGLGSVYFVSRLTRMQQAEANAETNFNKRVAELRRQHEHELARLRCELWRRTGLHDCAVGKPREGLLFLARALNLAALVDDRPKRLAIADELLAATDQLPPLPEAQRLPVALRNRKAFRSGLRIRDSGPVVFATLRPRPGRDATSAIMTSDGYSSRFWDAATGDDLGMTAAYRGRAAESGFSANGMTVAVIDAGPKRLTLCEAATGKPLAESFEPGLATIGPVYVSPTGVIMAVTTGKSDPGEWELWDVAPGARPRAGLGPPPRRLARADAPVDRVTFSADGKTFLAWHGTSAVELWDSATAQSRGVRLSVPPEVAPSRPTDYREQGRLMVACNQREAQQWDLATSQPVGGPLPHPELRSARYTPDGKFLVTCASRDARFWDAATGRLLFSLEYPADFAQASFSADGRAFLAIHGDGVSVWPLCFLSLFSGDEAGTAMRWAEVLTGMEFAPDGSFRELDASAGAKRRRSLEQWIGLSAQNADDASTAGR